MDKLFLGEWPYRYDHLTSKPTNYRIQILKVAEAEVPGPEVFWMSHWQTWEKLYFYMIVIRGNGVTAVINTGPPLDLSELNKAWQRFAGERCYLKSSPEEQPVQALAKAGVSPEEVDYVLLTPLQAYTTANIALFPKARICLSKRGWVEDIMARPDYLHVPRQLCIPDEILEYLLFSAWERVSLLRDEDEICPGIRAWWAGTHHRSSMVFVIETQAGPVAIGDCAFKYANLNGHPLGIGESLAEGAVAYRRIKKEAAQFIPLYDPEVLERYPGGVVA